MMVKKVHQKLYRQYDTAFFFDSLIEFACRTDGISIRAYLKTKEKIPKSSFLNYFKQSGLAELKLNAPFDVAVAKMMLTIFLTPLLKTAARGLWKLMLAVATSQTMRSIP